MTQTIQLTSHEMEPGTRPNREVQEVECGARKEIRGVRFFDDREHYKSSANNRCARAQNLPPQNTFEKLPLSDQSR